MGDVKLTYEDLFEILRRERTTEDLQFLDKSFYSDLINYFKDKQKVIDDTSEGAQLFGGSEKEKVATQLENAKKIAKELMERREKKVLALALNKARTNSDIYDTSALLDVEQELFHKAGELFTAYKKGALERVLTLNYPLFGAVKGVFEAPEEEAPATPPQSVEESSAEMADEPMIEVGNANEPSATVELTTKMVRFKSSIPKFMGKDAQIYGPYSEEETASLSSEIADILINKGRAELIEK